VDRKLLEIYLQDHLAGSVAGLELARRAAGSNRDGPYGAELAEIRDAIDEHRQILLSVARELGVGPSRVKDAPAWIGEKLGRLKLNGRITGYSPLSRLLELEGLFLGLSGQIRLWNALGTVAASHGRIGQADPGEMAARTERLCERVAALHARAAGDAFA